MLSALCRDAYYRAPRALYVIITICQRDVTLMLRGYVLLDLSPTYAFASYIFHFFFQRVIAHEGGNQR